MYCLHSLKKMQCNGFLFSGIVETENGACRYAPKSVSAIPGRVLLRRQRYPLVETWSLEWKQGISVLDSCQITRYMHNI